MGSPAFGFEQGRFDRRVKRVDAAVAAAGAGLLVLALLVTLAATLWIGRPQTSVPTSVSAAFDLNGLIVRVPSAWTSETSLASKRPRAVEHLALRVPLAELLPGPTGAETTDGVGFVGVTITAKDAAVVPSERPGLLYARFLSAEATPGEGGLIRRTFRAGTPYEGEALYVAPPDGRAFAARCLHDPASATLATPCLAEMRLQHVDLQVRFAAPVLAHWQPLMEALRQTFSGA